MAADPVYDLIEPSPIVIEQRDVSATTMNDRAREPIKQVRRQEQIELRAQVSWGRSARVGFGTGGQTGVSPEASGYLVFLISDLEEKDVTLDRGDRVISIGGKEADVYLTDQMYTGHGGGKPHHEIWDFVDYEPTKVKQ